MILLALAMLCTGACGMRSEKTASSAAGEIWKSAVYTENTELGEGTVAFSLEVKAEERSVVFTVHTDKKTVGEALQDCELIAGEQGPYGLYIKTVNGITADYDTDQTYWAFYINGEYAVSGADTTDIAEGGEYQLVRTK